MNENIKKYLKIFVWLAIIITLSKNYFYDKNLSFCVFIKGLSFGTTVSFIISSIYFQWLWKYSPLEKTPRLSKVYKGEISYSYNGEYKKKAIVSVQQSLFFTQIKVSTDEMTSHTISSSIRQEDENGDYILYYVYTTHSHADCYSGNPNKIGSGRIELKEAKENWFRHIFLHHTAAHLKMDYWTIARTVGTIDLKEDK